MWEDWGQLSDEVYQPHDMVDKGLWFNSSGTKLKRERWIFWAEKLGLPCPVAALGPVSWVWKSLPPASIEVSNHNSALLNLQPLVSELVKAEKLGLVEYLQEGQVQEDFVTCINPFGVRIKPNGKARILVDPTITGVNGSMSKLPCVLTTPETFLKSISPTDLLGKRDLTNGFYHVTLHPTARRFSEEGLKASCDVYVDDYPMRAESHEDMQKAFKTMDQEAELLGLEFNLSKDEGATTPTTRLEVLGLLIDAPLLKLDLPAHKKRVYRTEVQKTIQSRDGGGTLRRKELERLVGKLVWASKVTPWGYLHIQHLFDALYPVTPTHATLKPQAIIPWDQGTISDLRFWDKALALEWHDSVGMHESMLARRDVHVDSKAFKVHMYTDASKVFGAGGTLGHDTFSYPWPETMQHVHIGILELRACMICLQHLAHELAGTTVLCYMDNVQAVSAVNKGGSRIPGIRDALAQIALTGLEFGFTVKAKHVKGVLNPADAPSRGVSNSTNNHYMYKFFATLNNPPATIDCFAAADGYNRHEGCTRWFSIQRPIDVHWQQLIGRVAWANIPFAALGPTLDLLHAA
eukprot:gene22980-biopygen31593